MGVFGIGPMELILVLVVALVVFGPARLPELAAGLGRAIREFRKISAELTAEVSKVTDELTEIQQTVTHEVQEVKQAAAVNLDLNGAFAQAAAAAVAAESVLVAYQPSSASVPEGVGAPATAGSFADQVGAATGHLNGSHSGDPFQNAILELKRAQDQPSPSPDQTATPSGSQAEAERQTESEAPKSTTASALPMQWYSGT